VRRTSATGDEVEGTTNVIARLVAFKFSFDDGYGMRFLPIPHVNVFFLQCVQYTVESGRLGKSSA
jgi:hypothetical protein